MNIKKLVSSFGLEGKITEQHARDIEKIIEYRLKKQLKRRDEQWETAIRYNVDDEQWVRIKLAFNTLIQ